ncbi:aldo/keto reductase [Tomitella biformata]|uniref:aldo/keto reductase n=1 Tax=Tomitella biformata TaxID=630403 RepID=UPI000463F119|nr:aldo/keto reductase [Tomitella biformata]
MEYRKLGQTGVFVSPLCLGTMMFGAWGNADKADSIRIIHRALDAGINFVDTADVYSAGESERIVGEALKGCRDDVVLATKFFMPMGDEVNQHGGSRRWIVRAVEDSLRRLQTDHIDLYQVHRPSPDTDIEETLGALSDLVHQGKVRYLGSSTFPASHIVEAQWTARDRHLQPFATEQPSYSILVRGIEQDVLPTIQRHGMGAAPISSARSRLAMASRYDLALNANQRKLDVVEGVIEVADDAGLTLIELALAFALRHPAVTSAIIGPRTMEQLESQLPAADVTLGDDVLDRTDALVAPGTAVNPADNGYGAAELAVSARRR